MLQPLEKKIDLTPEPPSISGTSLEDQIGDTPLLRLDRIAASEGLQEKVQLLGKAEWFNPSGSVKDRAALNIIRSAELEGKLKPGMTILDSTSGNMGISLAMLGAAREYRLKLILPENVSQERVAILLAYGAELIFTDPLEGSDGAQLEAQRLASAADQEIFYANQYNNPANWRAHYFTTANEIWNQTAGQVTHFIAGAGTSGTLVGTARRLKELNHEIVCIGMQPDGPFHGLEGLKHMPSSIKPGIYDPDAADQELSVKTEDAYRMAKKIARIEGLFLGFSAAAAVVAGLQLGRQLDQAVVVTVLPDNGFKYLSERFWSGE